MFAIMYVIEVTIRIFASGFVDGQHTYLRSFSNILDFIIVISSLSEMLSFGLNLRILRALRLLRLFKSL